MNLNKVKDVKRKHEKSWLSLDDVVSVGIGVDEKNNRPIINVGLRCENRATREKLPTDVEGVPLRVEVSGDISAF